MASLVDCYHFLLPPRVKARLKEFLVHLKLYEARHRELKAKIQNLKKARDSVQRKVDEEDNRYGNGIPREVADWIKAVDTIISECDEFDEDEDHQLAVFDLFKSGYLPKTGIRYRLSTKAFAITSKVNGLLQTAKHDTYSYWLGPPSIASFFHTVGYESFPSREESMKKIKEALKSPNVRVIGLHGLSGVGKTTLVKKIARDALQASEADKMFDVVAMSSITRNPDIRQIQGHIADALGMKLDEESDIARAARIRRRLKNESTLIILDDLWAALDLNMLGIPLDVDDGDGQHILTETAKEISSGNVREGKIPGLFSKTETTNEISSGNVREGKIPGLLTKTKTMKEIPFGNLKEGKIPGEHRKTKTMKEIPYGNVNEGKSSGEHSKRKSEGNNSVVNMMKSRKLPSASNMKTEETLSHYKGCKVLLISESKQVLLSQLEGKEDSIYFINVLKEKESETFFKKMAGIGNGKTEFDKLTMSIVHKCNGLPMSIVTTARALKNQSCSVWEDVHRHLERGNLTGVSDFSTKLSYDLLEDEELKYAFLLCARMGPDALIVDLVKYCIGLGFLQEIYTVKEARDRVYVLVGKLKVFGLLSDSYSSDHFTMQDIVRSAALSIASKEKHVFTKTKGKIDEWPDKLESYAAISLHHCHIIDGFPREINYPRLRFFQVNNNDPHLKIPKNFFEGMKELRVLLLTGIRISPLDSSIASLTELKMLAFEQCMLDKKLSVIGELKKLRILSFSGSDIEKLPVELKQLKKLQIFDISNCSKLTNIPSNVISSLISLEELYMRNTLIQWKVEEQNYQSENASLSELRHLNQLTTLDIHISDAAHLPKNLFFDKLYSYKIVVGDMNAYSDMDAKMPEKYEASRFLAIQLKNGCNIHSQKGIKMLFERVETLFLEELNGVKDIFFRLSLKGFPYLKHLLIVNNSDIQSLINPEDRQHTEKAFPKLESLHLYNLKSISEICSCKLSAPSFRKLKVIKINLCGKLTSVVLFSVVSLLTVLETIEVSECNTLMAIVASETESNSNERGVLNFPELRTLTLMSLPELIGFYPISSEGEDGAKATELFDEKVELPKLERMVLSSIQINKVWSDQSMQISCFKNLIHMDVNGCWNLEYLISFSMAKSLVNLQSLFVSECEKMSYIFPQGQGSHAKMKGSVFPNLKSIKLSSMKSLLEIWNFELPSNSFEKLDTLIIEECDKLVNVFPCYVAGMFRSLCNLRVTNCKSMKLVFELDDKKRNEVDVTNMQDVYLETLPKLEHVWKWSKDRVGILELKSLQKMCVHDCYRLENIFPVSVARLFPILEYLVIRDCFELREIVPKRYSTNNTSNLGPFFEFPNLTTIKFSDLPKLSGFYPGAYKLSCPALNDLTIELCDRLEPFKKETTEAQTRSTIFSKEVINKLKCMHIESWHAKLSSSYLRERNHRQDNLEELCLSRLMNPGILYSFLHRSPNLKSLSLSNCFVTDIVPHKMPPEIENLGVVPKLEKLMLLDMPDLETIGFEEGIILERIELLILKQCPLLVNIMPSSVSLTHLTNLEVVSCGGLKILMPLSAAKSLVQLNSMKVVECESMEEIVGNENENGGEVDKIVENENVLKHNPTMKNNLFFSLLFILSFSTLTVFSHLFSPLDNYLINSGSTLPTTLHENRPFTGDLVSKPSFSTSSRPLFINNQNPLPNLPPIYNTARVFTKPTKYSFPIKDKGTHLVRFHFHAFNSSNLDLGRAQFQILVDGYVVLSNFTRFVTDCQTNPKVVEYLILVESEKLVIVFVPNQDSKLAFVNAIEVISAPKDLVPEKAQYLSSGNLKSFDGLNNQALEVVHRVTVGGPKVTPFNDSLWRTWVPDFEFLISSVGSEKYYFGGRINYRVGGASREVGPDNVYNTARLIRSKNDSVPNVNMTWVFPVVGGYKYLVRLHFCDIASISMRLLYFNVYVNGQLALEDLDLSLVTDSLASPFYADFVVDVDVSIGALSVTIGPSKSSLPHVIDGMLNAVEVMKLNNTHKSLDGDVCADFVLKSRRSRGNTGIFLTLVAAVCIVLSLSLVIRRRIIESRESVSWSRLPVNLSENNVKG